MAETRALVSIVVPAFNEADCLPTLHAELRKHCDGLPFDFEFLFVDDGSSDDTIATLQRLRHADPRICYLSLSRNFGHQPALSAGLAHASGDAVISMDGDLQHPPALIPKLLERWRAGFDIVNTCRLETEAIHPLKHAWSFLFYRFFNRVSEIPIAPGGADFRLMSRLALRELNALPERHRFLRGLVPWLGYRQTVVEFSAPPRFAGAPKINFVRSLRFALDGLTSFSLAPLRGLTTIGSMAATLSVAYAFIGVLLRFMGGVDVPGWSFLVACMLFLSGLQFAGMGILGEYLGRVLEQVKGRPLYIVRDALGVAAPERETVPFVRPRQVG